MTHVSRGLERRTLLGFTLVEALVFLFLFSVITLTFYQLYAVGTRHILDAKRRLGAVALANQRMEMIRGMPYEDIGTKTPDGSGGWSYGIPAGEILETETISASGASFLVHTFVRYVDDAYDGEAGGSDLIPADYKSVRVSVSWGETSDDDYRTVSVFGVFAQDGIEQLSGTGVLSINVLGKDGLGVPQVTVHLVNSSTGTDLTTQTDNDGNLLLPGAPPSGQEYEVTVSKSGYYGATTYPPASGTAFDPENEHAAVVENAINPVTILMDRESDVVVRTVDPFGDPISGVDFHLEGGRHVATDNTGDEPKKIYSLSVDDTTDGSGEVSYEDESYGRYFIKLGSVSESTYELFLRHPDAEASEKTDIIEVEPGEVRNVVAVLLDPSVSSVVFYVNNGNISDPEAIGGASVHLFSNTLGYDETVSADSEGIAAFGSDLAPLVGGTYDFEISAPGYDSFSDSVTVSGSGPEKQIIVLSET